MEFDIEAHKYELGDESSPFGQFRDYLNEHGEINLLFNLTKGGDGVKVLSDPDSNVLMTLLLVSAMMERLETYHLLRGAIASFEGTILANQQLREGMVGKTVMRTRKEFNDAIDRMLKQLGVSMDSSELKEQSKPADPDAVKKLVPVSYSAS